jgi:hypothetical protein
MPIARFYILARRMSRTGQDQAYRLQLNSIPLYYSARSASRIPSPLGPSRLSQTRESVESCRTGLAVVKQAICRLRTRPIATRFVDRRAGRLRQLFRSLDQTTIQTLVGQIHAAEFLLHPADLLRARLENALHVRICDSRSPRHATQHLASHGATRTRAIKTRPLCPAGLTRPSAPAGSA